MLPRPWVKGIQVQGLELKTGVWVFIAEPKMRFHIFICLILLLPYLSLSYIDVAKYLCASVENVFPASV